MTEPKGLLLVTMEPQALSEEEFNDWYDTEHVPERGAMPGFLSAMRYVCIQGWPRYMALYDLDSLAALRSPEYLALSGDGFTPWSKRVLPRVQGQFRVEGSLLYPDDAVTLTGPERGRLALFRFRAASDASASIVAGLRERFEGRPEVAQLRVLRIENHGGDDLIALVEQRSPLADLQLDPGLFAGWSGCIDMANVYTPYWRRGSLPGVM